jgi:hypothetical protein
MYQFPDLAAFFMQLPPPPPPMQAGKMAPSDVVGADQDPVHLPALPIASFLVQL